MFNPFHDVSMEIHRQAGTYHANQTQKDTLIELILKETPYTPESRKYQAMKRDLDKLEWDTLFVIRQSQKKQ